MGAREILIATGVAALLVPSYGQPGVAEPRRMLREHLTRLALTQLEQRRKTVAGIRSRGDLHKRQRDFRAALLKMIGGLPEERPPLSVERTGRLDRGEYRVEKIIFQSQPGLYITANLYIPQTGQGPFPAVLHSIGHSLAAKNRAFYQTLSIGLVKHGFVVLAYDPVGQGERRIFYDKDLEDSKVGGSTIEHEMVGIQALLAGESIARLMIWDGMRALDFLESLPEVDARRIGATGCSGGGTLTTYLAALDPRIRVAAPACYITSWQDQLQANTGPQDAEQQFPDLLYAGYDHADFVEAFAPKPYLICSTDQDFFPLSGARRTFEEASRMYRLLGAHGRIDWFHEPGDHGMPQRTREAIYGWMKRWLGGGQTSSAGYAPGGSEGARVPMFFSPLSEPPIATEYEPDLNATATGQLATSKPGETASTITLRRLAERVRSASPAGDIAEVVSKLIRYQAPAGAPAVQPLETAARTGYSLERLAFEQSNGRRLPALLALPGGPVRKQPVLVVGDQPASAQFEAGGDLDALAQAGHVVLAVDLSGRGKTASDWRSYSEPWFSSGSKETWLALMTGRTLVGIRSEDVVSSLNLLAARNLIGAGGVIGFGRGQAAVDLLHAAVLDARIHRLLLEDMLVSYAAVARSPVHKQVFGIIVPGALGRYDLPGLAAALAPRPVTILNARSAVGNVLGAADAAVEYKHGSVRIGLRREPDTVLAAYPELR